MDFSTLWKICAILTVLISAIAPMQAKRVIFHKNHLKHHGKHPNHRHHHRHGHEYDDEPRIVQTGGLIQSPIYPTCPDGYVLDVKGRCQKQWD